MTNKRLFIRMEVYPSGMVNTTFETEGLHVIEVGPLLKKAINSLEEEFNELEACQVHQPRTPCKHDWLLKAGPDGPYAVCSKCGAL